MPFKKKYITLFFSVLLLSSCTIMLSTLEICAVLINEQNADTKKSESDQKTTQTVRKKKDKESSKLMYTGKINRSTLFTDLTSSPAEKTEIPQTEALCEYICDICAQRYKHKKALFRHKRLKHLPCGGWFTNSTELKLHKENCAICQNSCKFKSLKLIVSIKIADSPGEPILYTTKRAEILQAALRELIRTDEPFVQDNNLDELSEEILLQESNRGNQLLHQLRINDLIDILSNRLTGIIFEIQVKLSVAEGHISSNDYSNVITSFTTIAQNIVQFKALMRLLSSVDSEITENKHAAKIKIISDEFKSTKLTCLPNNHDIKDLIVNIRQSTNKVFGCMHAIFADWKLKLSQTKTLKNRIIKLSKNKNTNLSEDENNWSKDKNSWSEGRNFCQSKDENISLFDDKSINIIEDENITSLHTDPDFSLKTYFITLPDELMLQETESDLFDDYNIP
ncbi:MAG: hypothetical protein OXD32_03700 [Endozoicomonadaceae bacterium]|nr:hypothetical protein [Endozoicomonadaceae bacterium]MCY4329122.1 hypothetical protein [Endozoicomonadaceae bacterium]